MFKFYKIYNECGIDYWKYVNKIDLPSFIRRNRFKNYNNAFNMDEKLIV